MGVTVSTDVIRRARTGDRQALVRLVEAYQGPVYSLALSVMRDRADAADVTQETFVRLLRSLPTYRGEGGSFTSWVHRMTINMCLDTLRRRQRGGTVEGRPYGEIATRMGVPLNTVKSHISRGKERMARLLDPRRAHGHTRLGLAAAA